MKQVHDPVLGEIRFDGFCWEFEHEVPFLGTRLAFRVDPEEKGADVSNKQRQVFKSILRMPPATRKLMEQPIYGNYVRIRRIVEDDTMPEIATSAGIWRHMEPRQILIPRHRASKHSYFCIAFECDWEPEHGLEVLFKDGAVEHASQQDGLALSERWFSKYIKE